jgi:hypothetical protein
MRNTKVTAQEREPFTKYAIAGTLTAILAVVISVGYHSYQQATVPTREVQEGLREALEDYHRAAEELRRLQEEGDGR